jgi:hypothetical protein
VLAFVCSGDQQVGERGTRVLGKATCSWQLLLSFVSTKKDAVFVNVVSGARAIVACCLKMSGERRHKAKGKERNEINVGAAFNGHI